MRVTAKCFAQHIGRGFKFEWHLKRKRSIRSTGAAEALTAKGIRIYDPKEIFSPLFNRVTYNIPPLSINEVVEPTKPSHYVFHDFYTPPGGFSQVQRLTNTVARPTLPQRVLEQIRDNSGEEDLKVQEIILQSHLMDSHQEKLPRVIDVINHPGWSFPREYGSPVGRKNKHLTSRLVLLLDQLSPESTHKHLMTNASCHISLEKSSEIFHMKFRTHALLSSSKPLSPIADEGEILTSESEVLPDIYPLSPFLNCKKTEKYDDEDHDSLATRAAYPHTFYLHVNMPRPKFDDDGFLGLTLMKAFGNAAAYAKSSLKVENGGNLETPLTIQVVHIAGKKFHFGVLQLNTLNLDGPRKNIFWYHAAETLFDVCNFKGAQANLEGYNPRVFSLLRALHAQ